MEQRPVRHLVIREIGAIRGLLWSFVQRLTTDGPERQSRNRRSDRDTKGRSDRAGDYGGDPGPRMEHGLNTERERTLTALEKEGSRRRSAGRPSRFIEGKYQGMVVGDSQLPLEGLFWESVFHPCSIRGSPENLVGNGRFLLIVVRMTRMILAQTSIWTTISPN